MKKPLFSIFFIFILFSLAYPVAVWKKDTGHPAISFSLCSGTAYVGFSDGTVSAFQSSDGQETWSVALPNYQVPSSLACDAETVYAGTKSGSIVMLVPGTGEVKGAITLSRNSTSGYVTSITVVPPYIFASSYGAYLVNPQAGAIRWSYPTPSISSPLGFSQASVFFESNGTMYSLDANTGSLGWSAPIAPTFLSAPYYSQNRVYMGATSNSLHAFDTIKGAELWEYETAGWVSSTPVAYLDLVYFGSNDHYAYAVTSAGALAWKFKTGEAIQSRLQIVSGKGSQKLLAFTSNDGYLYLLDPATGSLYLRTQVGGPSRFFAPVDGGMLVVSDDGGIGVYSLDSGCNFDLPVANEYVNAAKVHVYGTAFSGSGVSEVQLRVNGGDWQPAVGASNWSFSFDPGDILPGPFIVECRVLDSSGKIETGIYSSLPLVKSTLAKPETMNVRFDPWYITSQQPVNIYVTDSAGDFVEGATVKFEDKTYTTGSKPLEIMPMTRGQEFAVADKLGYVEAQAIFYNMTTDSSNLVLPGVMAVLMLLVIYVFFLRRKGGEIAPK